MTKTRKNVVLLDGGMGQEIVKRSGLVPTPLWSTRVMLDNPDLVRQVHIDFIKAGARVITLNNYTATRERLSRDASVDLLKPIHSAAVKIARDARAQAGVPDVQIAGCLPPLMASYKPELAPPAAQCLASYRELVALQKRGVDLFMIETASTIREAQAATEAAAETGLPAWVSFTLDDDASAKLRSGESLEAAIEAVIAKGASAVMINCSMPETIDRALDVLQNCTVPTGAYANGFTSTDGLKVGGTVTSLSARTDLGPTAYAEYGLKWAKAGLSIIGGCCETSPEHIAALRDALAGNGYRIESAL